MEQTIAAISTPIGEGGIGIVRLSGEKSLAIIEKIFKGEKPLENRKLTYGKIVDPETKVVMDEVLTVFMKGPKTYTCEDVVEIHCHGSNVAVKEVLSLCFSYGAVPAEAGEFTKRAFLNGRLDLTQAEAVIDVIKAKTKGSFDVAMDQLEGGFSHQITDLRKILQDILVNITVNIDYPDEDIEEIVYKNLEKDIDGVVHKLEKLLTTANQGKIFREGLHIAIIGKPNVGKSSLMNELLGEQRAIVTEIPGTTRDVIQEGINIGGIPIILTDTAGIRDTDNVIEKIGIEKSKDSFNNADMIFFLVDGSRPLEEEDEEIIRHLKGHQVVTVINKQDLPSKIRKEELKGKVQGPIVHGSVKKKQGIAQLETLILDRVYEGKVERKESSLVTNVRQENLLKKAKEALEEGRNMVEKNMALEFIEVDIMQAYEWLGEITGETFSADIIDEVFARFCLGK